MTLSTVRIASNGVETLILVAKCLVSLSKKTTAFSKLKKVLRINLTSTPNPVEILSILFKNASIFGSKLNLVPLVLTF